MLFFNIFLYIIRSLSVPEIKAIKKQRYTYCLCPTNRFDRCKSDLSCDSYQVPLSNYITTDDQDAFSTISQYNDSDITIYLTSAGTSTDLFNIRLNGFNFTNNTLKLIAVDTDSITNIYLRDTKLYFQQDFECMIQGAKSVSMDEGLAQFISVLTLRNSPLSISEIIDIRTLVTDSQSISTYQGTINILENLTFSGANPAQLKGKLNLQSNSSLNLEQSSSFPMVSLRNPTKTDDQAKLYVYLSDEYEDRSIPIGIYTGGDKIFNFKENSFKIPSITVTNRFTGQIDDLGNLTFNFLIPSQGMNVMINKTSGSGCVSNFPNGFYIIFGEDTNDRQESQTDASLLQLSLDIYCGGNYPIKRFDGNINLRLMTSSTVQAILSLIDEGITINNLDSLTINVENYLTNVKFVSDGIKLTLGGNQNLRMVEDDADSITLFNNASETFYLICSSPMINFDVDSQIDSIHNLTIITQTENANLNFTQEFIEKFAKSITINHGNLPVTISTNGEYVPMVLIEDEVLNVSYESNADVINISNQTAANSKVQRAGPNIKYNFETRSIIFSQDVCLAKDVTFDGNDFIFDYINESISRYTFNKNVCIIHSKSGSNEFIAESLTFSPGTRFLSSLGSSQCQIDANVGMLDCHTSAIPSDAFSDSIKIWNSLNIASQSQPDTVKQVFFSPNSVRLDSSARVQQTTSNNGYIPGFNIHLNAQDRLTLSYEPASSNSNLLDDSKPLIQNSTLYLHGNPVDVYVDKSWYRANIPDSFKIVLDGKNTKANIETELLELPNFSFYYPDGDSLVPRNDFSYTTHEKPFRKTTGFIVLMVFVAIIGAGIIAAIIVGIVLCTKKKGSKKKIVDDQIIL